MEHLNQIRQTSDVTSLNLNVFVDSVKEKPNEEIETVYVHHNNSLPGITDESSRDDSEEYFEHRFKGE